MKFAMEIRNIVLEISSNQLVLNAEQLKQNAWNPVNAMLRENASLLFQRVWAQAVAVPTSQHVLVLILAMEPEYVRRMM
jgi:hypothetical protein